MLLKFPGCCPGGCRDVDLISRDATWSTTSATVLISHGAHVLSVVSLEFLFGLYRS